MILAVCPKSVVFLPSCSLSCLSLFVVRTPRDEKLLDDDLCKGLRFIDYALVFRPSFLPQSTTLSPSPEPPVPPSGWSLGRVIVVCILWPSTAILSETIDGLATHIYHRQEARPSTGISTRTIIFLHPLLIIILSAGEDYGTWNKIVVKLFLGVDNVAL